MTTEQPKQLDIVVYPEQQNIHPVKVTNHQYWYYSPFRDERTPSSKVNRTFNLWFDFGENKGGTIIDLGIRLKNCTDRDFLVTLNSCAVSGRVSFSFGQQYDKDNAGYRQKPAIKILSAHLISSYALVQYLQSRRINIEIEDKYLQEVRYQNNEKVYYALGIKNDRRGYELRSPYFKGSSSPKCITFIDNKLLMQPSLKAVLTFFLISVLWFKRSIEIKNLALKSTSVFEQQLPFMQAFFQDKIFLYNDNVGDRATALALSLDGKKFIDKRNLFADNKDFNEWWKLRPPD